jgi:hypothetical protein
VEGSEESPVASARVWPRGSTLFGKYLPSGRGGGGGRKKVAPFPRPLEWAQYPLLCRRVWTLGSKEALEERVLVFHAGGRCEFFF